MTRNVTAEEKHKQTLRVFFLFLSFQWFVTPPSVFSTCCYWRSCLSIPRLVPPAVHPSVACLDRWSIRWTGWRTYPKNSMTWWDFTATIRSLLILNICTYRLHTSILVIFTVATCGNSHVGKTQITSQMYEIHMWKWKLHNKTKTQPTRQWFKIESCLLFFSQGV